MQFIKCTRSSHVQPPLYGTRGSAGPRCRDGQYEIASIFSQVVRACLFLRSHWSGWVSSHFWKLQVNASQISLNFVSPTPQGDNFKHSRPFRTRYDAITWKMVCDKSKSNCSLSLFFFNSFFLLLHILGLLFQDRDNTRRTLRRGLGWGLQVRASRTASNELSSC